MTNIAMTNVVNALLRWSMLILFWAAFILVFAWVVAGVCYLDFWIPASVARLLALFVAIVILAGVIRHATRRASVIALCVVGIILLVIFQTRTPSMDGAWISGQNRLAHCTVSQDEQFVEIQDIRDFLYPVPNDVQEAWLNKTFDLEQIDSVWLGVDRFSDLESVAHTFISFGFGDGSAAEPLDFVAFSVEARREKSDDGYSPLRGIFNHYELHYVTATERDILTQRSSGRNRPVQLYPMRAEKSRMQKMFLDIVGRINGLRNHPEFYHTIRNNCTNNIVAHANHAGSEAEQINMWQRDVVFPGYSDWLAFQFGLIDTNLSLIEAREQFRVDGRASNWDGKSEFSQFIRQSDE